MMKTQQPEKRTGPGNVAAFRGPKRSDIKYPNYTANPSGLLLNLLDGVRVTGRGWVAKCPAHEDRSASLSVAIGDDGRVLLHCFAGCSAASVVAAVGLDLADLFPQRLGPLTPHVKRELSEAGRLARRAAALNAVVTEIAIVEVAVNEMMAGQRLGDADMARLALAHDRIHAARLEVQR